jgi:hypothetical protein
MIRISKKKQHYGISKYLRKYLFGYDRERKMPISYFDLVRYQHSVSLRDENDRDTLWETVIILRTICFPFTMVLRKPIPF